MVAVGVPTATTPLFPIGLKSSRPMLIDAPLLMVSLLAKRVYWMSLAEPEFRLTLDQANDDVVAVRCPPEFTWSVELPQVLVCGKVAPETFIVPLTTIPNVALPVST